MGRPAAELEVRWVAASPGDPMAYLIGKREITALARDFSGVRRRFKAFHDELLRNPQPRRIRRGMGLD